MRSQPIDGSFSTSQTPMLQDMVRVTPGMQPGTMKAAPALVAAVPALFSAVPPLPRARLAPPPSRSARATRQPRSRSAFLKRRAVNLGGRRTAATAGPPAPATLETLAVALAVDFKALDGKLNKLQAPVDGVSSVTSAEASWTNDLAVLAQSTTAVQSGTTSALAELEVVTHAAAATLRDAPAFGSMKSANHMQEDEHAADRASAKEIKKKLLPLDRANFRDAVDATSVYRSSIWLNWALLTSTMGTLSQISAEASLLLRKKVFVPVND